LMAVVKSVARMAAAVAMKVALQVRVNAAVKVAESTVAGKEAGKAAAGGSSLSKSHIAGIEAAHTSIDCTTLHTVACTRLAYTVPLRCSCSAHTILLRLMLVIDACHSNGFHLGMWLVPSALSGPHVHPPTGCTNAH